MENIFVTNIKIENVRHLKDIDISLSKDTAKHLIFTGKNGSGKTSVLEALSHYLNAATTSDRLVEAQKYLQTHEKKLKNLQKNKNESIKIIEEEKGVKQYTDELNKIKSGVTIEFNESSDTLRYYFERGQFVVAYYKAERVFEADISKHVEKVDLKEKYTMTESPRKLFVKYLLDLKVTEAMARNSGKISKADNIKKWFDKLEDLMKKIFDDSSLRIIFDEETFKFTIKEDNREPFDFNTLSSGYAAILDIVLDLIMRMEKITNRSFDFSVHGVVLIDEIETHLHLELQKTILEFLTTIFPNIQFIISTHSPFILNCLDNVVIYDLENQVIVNNGLSNVPYSGIVEGYFKANEMSNMLREKYERYKELVVKKTLTDDDFEEIADLEMFLNEIPDYLALNITTEYQRLKTEFENRKDI